jgi:hypothetical protein
MSKGLRLVVENDVEAVKQENSDTKLRAGKIEVTCTNRFCRYVHKTTMGYRIDNPECPKCGK